MTNNATIFACADPLNTHWRLGALPPAQGHLLLIGWRLPSSAVDSGVPEVVGAILAHAFTSIARVTFPVSDDQQSAPQAWPDHGDDAVIFLRSDGLYQRAQAAFKGEPAIVKLISTCEPMTVVRMFEDPGYPWRLQGQVAVLSPRDSQVPDIDRNAVLSLISEQWIEHCAQLRGRGIEGVIRPGVDGDILGVYSLNDEFTRNLLEALEHAVRQAKFDWFCLPEEDFTNMLATA